MAAVVAAGEAADEEHAREETRMETREKPWGHACTSFVHYPPCGSFLSYQLSSIRFVLYIQCAPPLSALV